MSGQIESDKELTSENHPSRADRMRSLLIGRFHPDRLEVIDDSAKHTGHAGAQPGGETHYSVTIVAADFAGMSRLARHRAVAETLDGEFKSGLHALALSARAPGET